MDQANTTDANNLNKPSSALKVGDWVEIRSKEEILRTLDADGTLGGMPFMPEMFQFCGKKFQVHKRAHKTCDTVFPVRGRRVPESVHLDTRCDGQAHGGCQAGCLLFWKEAWLKPINVDLPASSNNTKAQTAECSEEQVRANVQKLGSGGEAFLWSCQATQLPYFTTPLNPWDIRQYIEDYRSGNVGLWRLFCGWLYSMYFNLSEAGIGVGAPMRWSYNQFHFLRGGKMFPREVGPIPMGHQTPKSELNLQPGELVRVKSHKEILATLNVSSKNRGMGFDAEMVPFCGKTYRVLRRVTHIVDEKTGKMQEMKTPCIILDNVVCEGRYSYCRMFCPRAIYPYWREIWLERIGPEGSAEKEKNSGMDVVRIDIDSEQTVNSMTNNLVRIE
jgi:hypothetical protein